ncbi:peptidoglycan editing factor PgeF [Uliginosibacterium sp. sgz301328]|uniref:peptidoglycan editing factor PgeF n=1 Tax=Uliginosibacterium sp. sgz301328 TaxID=3243764 RepID=UPI00359CCAEB
MKQAAPVLLVPEWPAPVGVHALVTTRRGGSSVAPYDSFNLGTHVGDDPAAVAANRAALEQFLPAEPAWLAQVHGVKVVDAGWAAQQAIPVEADASVSRDAGAVCVVMTADCLPVLFASRDGSAVAAAHAGWRGLADGVLERTLTAMQRAPKDVIAWLGPAIGPAHFEVGPEVRDIFMRRDAQAAAAFEPGKGDRWMADIFTLARQRLHACGMPVASIFGGGLCTVERGDDFFSYRRDRTTGRMAALVWRD